jgi:integrase
MVWLEEAKPRLEIVSHEGYEANIKCHIYPYFKKLKISLSDLTYQHLHNYYTLKSKTLSANTIKRHHTLINQTLRKALKNDLIHNNPADKVTLPKVKKYTGKYLTVEEGNSLLDYAKGTPIETAVVLAMMYGLRRSEIAGLKWDSIDFKNDTLIIQHTRVKHKTEVAKDRTKNKSSYRILPLNSQVKTHLLKLRAKQAQDKLLLGQAYHDTDYVCRWGDGRILKCDYFSSSFKKLLKKNGLPDIRFHDLRHSCASYMLKMGCSLKDISDWLGHATIQTSIDIYAHLDIEAKKSVATRFGSLLQV